MVDRRLLTLLVVACFGLTACGAPAPQQSPTSTPTPTHSPSPSPTPTVTRTVTITLDGLAFTVGGGTDVVQFDDTNEVVTFLGALAGASAALSDLENAQGTHYTWDGFSVTVFEGGWCHVWLETSQIGQARIETAEGIAVGSTRDEAVAAGAQDGGDTDGDGVADWLRIGSREVPGTEVQGSPGTVGSEYVMLTVEDNVITEIFSPSNNFVAI